MAGFFDDFGIGDAINIGSAAISAGASFFGSQAQAKAANAAAGASTDFQNRVYNDSLFDRIIAEQASFKQADMMGVGRPAFASHLPGIPGGFEGLTPEQLAQIPAMTQTTGFEASPGYKFRLEEGMKALNNNLAASGMLNSGGRIKATNDYAQGQASQEFNNTFNQLNALKTGAQAQVNTSTGIAGSALADANQSRLAGATARASGFTGAANAGNNLAQNLLFAQALKG